MEATKEFIEVIKDYLETEASKDAEFREKMVAHPEKTPEGACNYIMSEVSKSKKCGWSDDEIFGMAKHFIDEDDVKDPGSEANEVARVVDNRHVDLTKVEREEAKEEAKREYLKQMKIEEEKMIAKKQKMVKDEMEKKKRIAEERKEKEKDMQLDLFGGM